MDPECDTFNSNLIQTVGVLDIIEDIDGVFWFIENNASGQWAYVEQATGQPIGRAIASLLESSANQ